MRNVAGLPLLACVAAVIAGCSSGPTQTAVSDGDTVGIRVVSPIGLSLMAWGNPSTPDYTGDTSGSGGNGPPARFAVFNAYPNPVKTRITIPIAVPTPAAVRVWVEQIGFPGWLATSTKLTGAIVTPDKARLVGVIVDQVLEAGYHYLVWQPAPVDVPTGIYRIFVKTSTAVEWRDVMLYRSLEELPDDLRSIVANWE